VFGPARSPELPDVPTAAEAGYPDLLASGWTGIIAPVGTPPAIVAKLQREVARVLALPAVGEALRKQGAAPVGSTPEAFGAFMKAEAERWAMVIEATGLTHSQ